MGAKPKRSQLKQATLLGLISLFDFGSTYIYDIPSSLEWVFRSKLGLSSPQSLLLYSAYSLPNLVVNILGGLLILRLGYTRCLRIYSVCVTLGQVLFAVGVSSQAYPIMLLGRFMVGCGAENLMITQYYSSHQTFDAGYVTFAIGINQCFTYLASFVGFYLVPYSYLISESLEVAVWSTTLAPAISLCAVLVFTYVKDIEDQEQKNREVISSQETELKIDLRPTVAEGLEEETRAIKSSHSGHSIDTFEEYTPNLRHKSPNKEVQDPELMAITTTNGTNPGTQHSFDLTENTDCSTPDSKAANQPADEELFDIRTFQWTDLEKFPTIFWYLCLLPLTVSCAYFQFTNICTSLIQTKFELEYSESKNIPTVFPLTLLILLPFLSKLAEKHGRRAFYLVASSLLGIVTYVFLYICDEDDQWAKIPLMTMMGVFFALYCCVFWSAVTQVLPLPLVNIGLSIANTIQNLSNFIYPIFMGSILSQITQASLQTFLWVLTVLLSVGFLVTLKISQLDYAGKKHLDRGDST